MLLPNYKIHMVLINTYVPGTLMKPSRIRQNLPGTLIEPSRVRGY